MDDRQITELNKRYLRRNGPTDVIAFSQIEGAFSQLNKHLLGDVVISLETAKRYADENSMSLRRELVLLLVHGILHLLGHDHTGSADTARKMVSRESELLRALEGRFQLGRA